MSVTTDASGRRSIQIELEVHGTPEEVWSAIATGPGVSSWFMPTAFEEGNGKPVAVTMSFGPGMEARSAVTAWDPPRMYATEADGWMPGSPSLANEWRVEARAGGVCIIRIVHSLFASTDEWDNQLEAAKGGWGAFLRTLELYLEYFRGQRSELVQLRAPDAASDVEAWGSLTTALGLKDTKVGQRWTAPAGAPAMSGVLEYLTQNPYDALLRLDTPGPGIAALGVAGFPGGPVSAAMNIYLYGDDGAETAARETPQWQAWMLERFLVRTE
jgi:uncharacterized protein YndB with AHSA1/START domain